MASFGKKTHIIINMRCESNKGRKKHTNENIYGSAQRSTHLNCKYKIQSRRFKEHAAKSIFHFSIKMSVVRLNIRTCGKEKKEREPWTKYARRDSFKIQSF